MRSLQHYRKGAERVLNIRSKPKHESELVGTVESQYEPLAFYGELRQAWVQTGKCMNGIRSQQNTV